MSEMIFYFTAEGDRLSLVEVKRSAVCGNVNSYRCRFELNEDWRGLHAVAVFGAGEDAYSAALDERGECLVPYEVLTEGGIFTVGLVGTNAEEENLRRISTDCVSIPSEEGAYRAAKAPKAPSPELWESLINRSVAKIGENGNWYIWDIEAGDYVDSGKPSAAEADAVLSENSEKPIQNKAVFAALSEKEDAKNKIDGINENATDLQYPSAKAVYEYGSNLYTEFGALCTALCADKEDVSNRWSSVRGKYPKNLDKNDARYASLYFMQLREEDLTEQIEECEKTANKITDTDGARPGELWQSAPWEDAAYFNANVIGKEFYKVHSEVSSLQNGKESTANKTDVISAESTDLQYPSAKAVYDLFVQLKNQ